MPVKNSWSAWLNYLESTKRQKQRHIKALCHRYETELITAENPTGFLQEVLMYAAVDMHLSGNILVPSFSTYRHYLPSTVCEAMFQPTPRVKTYSRKEILSYDSVNK